MNMGNILEQESKDNYNPADSILINPELNGLCELLVVHNDLRAIFSQYFLECDWITVFLGDISCDVVRDHFSYLLPSGGHLFVSDERLNMCRSPDRQWLQKGLSQQQSFLSRSFSTNNVSLSPLEHFPFAPPLLTLAIALRTFANSPEIENWKFRCDYDVSSPIFMDKCGMDCDSSSFRVKPLSFTKSLSSLLSFRTASPSTIIPFDNDVGELPKNAKSGTFVEKIERLQVNTKQLANELLLRVPPRESLSSLPSHLPPLNSPTSTVATNTHASQVTTMNVPSSTVNHNLPADISPVSDNLVHDNLRLILMDGVRSFGNSSESQISPEAIQQEIQITLASKQWLMELVRYLREELPFPVTISETPNYALVDDCDYSLYTASHPLSSDKINNNVSSKTFVNDDAMSPSSVSHLPRRRTSSTVSMGSTNIRSSKNSNRSQLAKNNLPVKVTYARQPPQTALLSLCSLVRSTFFPNHKLQKSSVDPSQFPFVFVNRAFSEMMKYTPTTAARDCFLNMKEAVSNEHFLLGQSMQLFVDESCTEMNQWHRFQDSQRDGNETLKLAITLMCQDRSKCCDFVALKPVIDRKDGEYCASLAIHYPFSGREETFPEDLQVADALLHLLSALIA